MNGGFLEKMLGRMESIFQPDLEAHHRDLKEAIGGSRILVIGGAGSIGSAFIRAVVPFSPNTLDSVDPSENNLAELVRDLRSSTARLPEVFRTFSIGFGSEEFAALLRAEERYDYVVNFAALKHVRSERDPFSLMRLFKVNVLSNKLLLQRLLPSPVHKVFSVSSDKAVNPTNLMGASKAFMERVFLSYSDRIPFSSARFANVAMSDGSLIYGFEKRLEKGQPIAAPCDIRRYFISPQEAGELCLLACFLGGNREIFFPKLDADIDLRNLAEVAELFLETRGYTATHCASEDEARTLAAKSTLADGGWPCFFAPSDTSGEKPIEEFYSGEETVTLNRFEEIGVVEKEPFCESESLEKAFLAIEELTQSSTWQKEAFVRAFRLAVPELEHVERHRSLDEKM